MAEAGAALAFREAFGAAPQVSADAPGRINLIGEHTDYHQGFVLPTVLPLRTSVHLRLTDGGRARVRSPLVDPDTQHYTVGGEEAAHGWLDYVKGVTWVLRQRGIAVPGLDVLIDSTLPPGAGVSSSAALLVALLRALRTALALPLGDVDVARLAYDAETRFVGAAVGIMDQMACSVGRPGMALFLDTRSLELEHIPIPATVELAVIDSGITHRHAGGEYAERRRESFAAAAVLGVAYLRDVGPDERPSIDWLAPVLRKRARHVVSENERVLAAVDALKAGDAVRLGQLLNASHASMRDDYETSVPDIDTLVSLAQAESDVYGARMTGGGFGGAVILLTHAGAAAAVAARVLDAYGRQTHRQGAILLPVRTARTPDR